MIDKLSEHVKWVSNHKHAKKASEDLIYFSREKIESVLRFQMSHKNYSSTPLIALHHLAKKWNVKTVQVKDESWRFGLNAFKVLGGIYAIGKYLAERLNKPIEELSFAELTSPEAKKKLGNITFITATDGNHGRAVAWAARELGQHSVVYMPKGASKARLDAIRNEGAHAGITDVNYDETVKLCAKLAEENGWILIQDTAWEGYEEIPLWIMQGYAAIALEIIDEIEHNDEQPPTHIFLQAGVGTFAAGIAAYFAQHYRANQPSIIVVEPDQADCFYRSFLTGNMKTVTGHLDTIMAGLACGVPNETALRILNSTAAAAFSCSDPIAALGMRILGNPLGDDRKLISGESGAVTMGLLYYLLTAHPCFAEEHLQLNKESRILLINTEGDTDKQRYRDIVWKGTHSISF
ncbi:diaminopropionate ammonia-lyase [Bacillus thermophilus]|uniref:Diaminopropionate ammonia-lyase n=1 Tax=Siminovitchia thermophila TaxID=1245522 RepID=A0ABS2R0F8_9BACI|nr:diaminopropionate ammonia-lyase [Siminovitchia thermophila]MBM7713125.1 diaminopropionate ammonia-lyase [Siminovitchia thermophila]